MKRRSSIKRETKETRIQCELILDGKGRAEISTPSGFLTHMLESWTLHSGVDLQLQVEGDIEVDFHHTVEDTGIVLGKAISEAIGDKKGIRRFGWAVVPMDEALTLVSIDLSGRPYFVMDLVFSGEKTGNIGTDLWEDFFYALTMNAAMNFHIKNFYGRSDHHKIESAFKAFANAFSQAVQPTGSDNVNSTKGVL